MIKNAQSGMVLIIVLMLLAVIAGLAVTLMNEDKINIERTTNLFNASASLEYLKGTQLWAKEILSEDIYGAENFKLRQFPRLMPNSKMDVPNLTITAELMDAQGAYYNINNLTVASHSVGFQFWLNTQVGDSRSFVQECIYWLSNLSNIDALKDAYYAALAQPFRVPHQSFGDKSEIKNVRYFSQSINQLIMPYLIALPKATPVNINTIDAKDPKILMSLGKGLTWVDVQQLMASRARLENGEFDSTGAFLALPVVGNAGVSSDEVTVQSNYFLLKTAIMFRQHVYHYETLFFRKGDPGKIMIQIIWQKQGN